MCHGCEAPMSELLGLRSYGRTIARSDGPAFRIWWSEGAETVNWESGRLSMQQFRRLGCIATQRVKSSTARLLFGLEPKTSMTNVVDRISSFEAGYSFLKDPRNNLHEAYLELCTKACLDPVDGLMTSERWNLNAVRRYLDEENELLVNIMLMMYLKGGQAPRTTEFFSIEWLNSPSNARGIYIDDGCVVFVTRHSKARKTTNQEFQVARYLSREDSKPIITYLVYIRPFADMLSRVCYETACERRLLFAPCTNWHKPWNADFLSSALKKVTKEVCGVAFGVQIYRQLSVAITEKHVKQMRSSFDSRNDKGENPGIEVVYAWQSGHRPFQRNVNYGIDSAYPDSLQPTLLSAYKRVSREWQYFLSDEGPGPRTATLLAPSSRKRSLSDCEDALESNVARKKASLAIQLTKDISTDSEDQDSIQLLVNESTRFEHLIRGHPLQSEGEKTPESLRKTSELQRQQTGNSENNTTRKTAASAFERLFIHHVEYRIVRCISCRYAVVPCQLRRHLKDHHSEIKPSERLKITETVLQLPGLAHRAQDVVYPPSSSRPIQGFPILEDALRCTFKTDEKTCSYVCMAVRTMQEHCKISHGWENNQKRGGDTRAKVKQSSNRMWADGGRCQRFFQYSQWRKYFLVDDDAVNN